MKKIAQFAVIGAVIGMGMVCNNAQAATDVAGHVFLSVNISLSGVVQTNENGVRKIRVTNKDIIQAIGTDTATVFSSRAKLLLVIPVGLEGENPSFVIRDIVEGANVDYVVSSDRLSLNQVGTSVQSSRTSSAGVVTETDAAIREFVFTSDEGSFDVQGYTTASSNNRGNSGDLLADTAPASGSAKVSGTGTDAGGNPAVVQGTITLGGRKVVNAD